METTEKLSLIGGGILLSSLLIFTLKSQASTILPRIVHPINSIYSHVGDAKYDSEFGNNYRQAQQNGWKTGTWGTSKYYIDDQGNLYLSQGELEGRLNLCLDSGTIANLRTINFTQPVQSSNNDFELMSSLPNVTAIRGLDKLNTSQVSMMGGMFADDYALRSLDLSHFDMSSVNNIGSMFAGDNSLNQLNIQSFGYSYAMGNTFQSTGVDEVTVGAQTNLWGGQGLHTRGKWKAPDGSISDAPDGSHPGTWVRQ